MIAEVSGKAHLFNAVVYLVEAPQEGHAVQKHVREPLYEVSSYEEDQQLDPCGELLHVDQDQLLLPTFAKQVDEDLIAHSQVRRENDNLEDVEIKEHVEGIEPEVLPHASLILPPRKGDFQSPYRQRQ